MRKALRPILIAAMVTVVTVALSGCAISPPNLTMEFFPEEVELTPDESIDVNVIMTVKGLGVLRISGVLFEFLDAGGSAVYHEQLPDRQDFPRTYALPVAAELTISVPLIDIMGEELVAEAEWWLPGVPHPAAVRMTFVGPGGKPVGGGELKLRWAEYVPSI